MPPQPYIMETLVTPPQVKSYDNFGVSVSLKDNAIAVGADVGGNSSQGVVHTFTKTSTWNHDREFIASDGVNGDRYGNSVVIFDEFLFVGAFLQDRSGKVYVYRNNEPHFELVPMVRVRDGYFGHVIKAKNYTLAVGQPSARVEHDHESGNVVVYNNWGLNWVISNYITPATPTDRMLHGFSIDFDRGDEMMVGAPKEGLGGCGYIYAYGQDDRWNVVHKELGQAHSELGHAVAISGNHSAMTSKTGGPTNNGYVVTFKREAGGQWVKGQVLVGDVTTVGSQGSAFYGNSIVMKRDVMAVGSPFEGATGAVYVYKWWDVLNEWRFHHKLLGPTPEDNAWYHGMFGWSLDLERSSINNSVLLVGAPGAKTMAGTERAGSVFIYSNFYFEQPTTTAPSGSPVTAPPVVAPVVAPTTTPVVAESSIAPTFATTTGVTSSCSVVRLYSLVYMAIYCHLMMLE